MYYNYGNIYEGDWKNGKIEGKGIYILMMVLGMKVILKMI